MGKPSPAPSHTALGESVGPGDSSLMEEVAAGGSLHVPPSLIWGLREGTVQGGWSGREEIGARPTMRPVHTTVQLWPRTGCRWVSGCRRGKAQQVYVAAVLMPLCSNSSAPLCPQPEVTKMPILEKAPQKMAAKTLSSEEETVSNFWSSLSLITTLPTHMPLASRIVLNGI